MTFKTSTLHNPRYNAWWPKLNNSQENKRKRLVRKYGKAFWNACANAAAHKSARRHWYWLSIVEKWEKKLDQLCKVK